MKNWLIIFVSVSFVLVSCNRKSQNAGEIGAEFHLNNNVSEFKVPVKITLAKKGNIEKKVSIYGKLRPKQETKISSQFTGRILNLKLSEGDRVKKGDVIAVIQSPQAEALQSAVSNKAEGKSEIVPYSIHAPFNGIVTSKRHYSGDVVSIGETILTIQDNSIYYLWGQLPADYLPDVKIGQQLKITFPGFKNKFFYGKIETINSMVAGKTQMAQIRTSLRNPQHLLKSDLFAKIDIVLRSLKDVILIPRNAVLGNGENIFVYLKKNGKAVRKIIRPGIGNADVIEVNAGLNVGDSVIVLGNYELQEGMKVEVMN